MCLATEAGGNGGILAIGDDYSKDTRIQWTDITQDQWYTGMSHFIELHVAESNFSFLVYMTNWFIGTTTLGVPAYDLNWDGVCLSLYAF